MKLGDYLDVTELRALMASKHIRMQRHPKLPMAILNYTNECMFDDFWPETVQKCRGLIINPVFNHEPCPDCEILSRPFHKFFNLNHSSQPDYLEANLPTVVPTVTEKMDGWFGIMWKCPTDALLCEGLPEFEYGVASRGSFVSPGAEFATQKLQKLVKYGAVEEFPAGFTPVFEIIFKEGKVVVDYPFEGLVLLGLVNNETGEELPYDELRNVWGKIAAYSKDNRPWIRLVKAHNLGPKPFEMMNIYESQGSWLNGIKDEKHQGIKDMEGFVLSYPRPGTFPIKVKVKFEEYKRLHRLITGITPQQIWESLHDPMSPWLGNGIPDHFRKWALKWRDELYAGFHQGIMKAEFAEQTIRKLIPAEIIGNISNHQDKQARENRKDVLEVLERTAPDYATIVLNNLDGRHYDAHQAIWNAIRPVGRESETFYRDGAGE